MPKIIEGKTVDEKIEINIAAWDKFGNKLKMREELVPIKITTPDGKVSEY